MKLVVHASATNTCMVPGNHSLVIVRLAVRTISALMFVVRPQTAPNDRLRALVGVGGCAPGTDFSLSSSKSSLAASLRHNFPVCDLAELFTDDDGGGVAGPRGELDEEVTEAEERDEGQGDDDGSEASSGTSKVSQCGGLATGIP